MEKELLQDAAGLGVLILLLAAVLTWGAILPQLG